MKNATPRQIAAIAAGVVAGIILLIILVIRLFFPDTSGWLLLFLSPLFLFVAGYFVFFNLMENFIYRKIKIIYKTIYDTKATQEEKTSMQKVRKDIIDFAESEVIQWKQNTLKEQKKQKKLERYRKEFLGNVFHELKTPIFNIQG